MGAFGAFVVFGACIGAGLRAFAYAFASPGVRSLARARLLYSIFS
jgi:amino acid permease